MEGRKAREALSYSWLHLSWRGKRLTLGQRNVLAEEMSSNLKSDYKLYMLKTPTEWTTHSRIWETSCLDVGEEVTSYPAPSPNSSSLGTKEPMNGT